MGKNKIEKAIEDLNSLKRDLNTDGGFEMWRDFDSAILLAISVLTEKLLVYNHPELPVTMENTATDISRVFGQGYRKGYSDAEAKFSTNKWVSVDNRLPEETDTDEERDFCVLAIHKSSIRNSYHWRSVADNPFDFTYWMPIPKSPEYKEISK